MCHRASLCGSLLIETLTYSKPSVFDTATSRVSPLCPRFFLQTSGPCSCTISRLVLPNLVINRRIYNHLSCQTNETFLRHSISLLSLNYASTNTAHHASHNHPPRSFVPPPSHISMPHGLLRILPPSSRYRSL